MSQNDPQSSRDAESLPAALQAELRALYQPPGAFRERRDAEVLGRVRRQHTASRWRSRRWVLAGAVAAAVALTAGTLIYLQPTTASAPAAPVYARTGDIRDAFYLARQLKAHQRPTGNWDVNHDGAVDQADVRSLALAAVRIGQGPGEGAGR